MWAGMASKEIIELIREELWTLMLVYSPTHLYSIMRLFDKAVVRAIERYNARHESDLAVPD